MAVPPLSRRASVRLHPHRARRRLPHAQTGRSVIAALPRPAPAHLPRTPALTLPPPGPGRLRALRHPLGLRRRTLSPGSPALWTARSDRARSRAPSPAPSCRGPLPRASRTARSPPRMSPQRDGLRPCARHPGSLEPHADSRLASQRCLPDLPQHAVRSHRTLITSRMPRRSTIAPQATHTARQMP